LAAGTGTVSPHAEAVEKLSQLVTNGNELEQIAEGLPVFTQQIQ